MDEDLQVGDRVEYWGSGYRRVGRILEIFRHIGQRRSRGYIRPIWVDVDRARIRWDPCPPEGRRTWWVRRPDSPIDLHRLQKIEEEPRPPRKPRIVDVEGELNQPGVYSRSEESSRGS
jgi:hypothetical protein